VNFIKLAPSILSADFTRLGEQIAESERHGADWIHVDVMDGRFVPNITMGPLIVQAARRVTSLPLDVHLMIVEPERHLEAFAKAGATAISVHYEVSPNLHRTLQAIRDLGCKAGVALNPHTPAQVMVEILDMVDEIVVMTVNPGFGGQTFLASTMPKIARLKAMIRETHRSIDLIVDGGINPDTAMTVVQAGADVLVAGSAIFNEDFTIEQGIQRLKSALE
jgi:ribulose-phosphate 3-epimerase